MERLAIGQRGEIPGLSQRLPADAIEAYLGIRVQPSEDDEAIDEVARIGATHDAMLPRIPAFSRWH